MAILGKALLYSICFVCSLTGIQQVSADGHNERNIGGTVKFFLSGGVLSPFFQRIDYKYKISNEPTTSGSGFVLDIKPNRGNHAIALDYYTFTETYRLPDLEAELNYVIDDEVKFNGLFLGYRYHFNSGFYIGGGVLSLDHPTRTFTFNRNEDRKYELIVGYKSISPLALTLGYDHIFASGFTLGVHLLGSSSIRSEINYISVDGVSRDLTGLDTTVFELRDGIIQSVGLGIGYSW